MTHWTADSTNAFIHRITFDFITQLIKRLESLPINQADLAQRLNVSEGAVSQVFNNLTNPRLKTLVTYARELGLKVALVAYDDKDPNNERGPINSEIFTLCWERANRPADFFSIKTDRVPRKVLTRGYVKIAGQQGKLSFEDADNLGELPFDQSQGLSLRIAEESTVGKAPVQHRDKTILTLVA